MNFGQRLRGKLRALEPRVLAEFERPGLVWAKPWLDSHDVFSFTRNPLAKGIAIGLFCGLIPGPLQILGSILLCVLMRGNIIAAAVATFYTNPFTIVPLYALAYNIGSFIVPGHHALPPWNDQVGVFSALVEWIRAMGWPLIVGLPTMALLFASWGYAITQILWLRPVIARARRMRSRKR
ncbi:MAG: DUF2062 domain-containing protein [Burkholderiales bacterium]|nr:MAG: DUF2062 domain-containing protein [Burkholderiales bacterium]TAG81401.1 MAG: DUF2062 domain-containing protein [Betaproteobacteria bacterium]